MVTRLERACVVVLVLVGVVGVILVLAVPARAEDRRPCVSSSEFTRFSFDWTKPRIHRFFETAGRRDGLNTNERRYGRIYPSCGDPEGFVVVAYSRTTHKPVMAIEWNPDD